MGKKCKVAHIGINRFKKMRKWLTVKKHFEGDSGANRLNIERRRLSNKEKITRYGKQNCTFSRTTIFCNITGFLFSYFNTYTIGCVWAVDQPGTTDNLN